MSLVTRCPACTTTFKVVRDQLRISDGWVRCGRCTEVFDATLDLLDTETGLTVPPHSFVKPKPPPLTDAPVLAPAPDPGLFAAGNPFDALQTGLRSFDAQRAPPVPARVPSAAWPAVDALEISAPPSAPAEPAWRRIQVPPSPPSGGGSLHGRRSDPHPQGLDAAPVLRNDAPWPMRRASALQDAAPPAPLTPAVAAEGQAQKAARQLPQPVDAPAVPDSASASVLRQASTDSADSPSASPPRDAALEDADFMASQPDLLMPPAAPRGRAVRRGLMALLVLLAGTLLAAQVLRHERDAWAASQPALRPAIAALCRLSGCVVSVPRRIDAVRIDGSSFTPSRQGERYELMFTLRNAAPTAVAMPSIELSLLDGNERPVVRRVFHPADFGAPALMGPRAEQVAHLHLALRLPPEQRALPVMGYSMLAFYP